MSALPMSEAQLQAAILDACAHLRLRVFHSGDSRRDSCAGWPDLVIVGPSGLILRELKAAKGRLRPEQTAWLAELTNAGQDADVWRPEQWPQPIVTQLRALARRTA